MQTTANGERAARELLRTDWDANGTVSVHLPADSAVDLLDRRGWYPSETGSWMSPAGQPYWTLSEALTVALLAEVV